MASSSNWLSGVNVVLVMAYGSLDLKEEIDIRLSRVQDIKYEPQLLADGDTRLLQLETQGNQNCYNYLYRMKALDAIRASEIPFHAEGRHPRSLMGKNFRSYLLDLRNTSTPFKGVRKALIDTLLDGYETARYGTGVFGQSEYLRYQEALSELATVVKARSGSSQRQHQSAAKDLTQSPEVSPTTIQVAKFTYSLYVADDTEPEEKPVCYPKDAGHHGTGVGTSQQAATDGPSSGPAPAVCKGASAVQAGAKSDGQSILCGETLMAAETKLALKGSTVDIRSFFSPKSSLFGQCLFIAVTLKQLRGFCSLLLRCHFLWSFFLFFFFKILFIHKRHRERGRDIGRGRSRLPAGSPMWDLILDPGIMP
ncbi:protein C1orf43 homolog isoform X2 [Canis lupus baileyi]|uniref:protein C1orf43 homolog isoform X13 n=2 Tax=Canis lupus familiaris TaxID=9615 RepID=UPI000BAA2C55|nr:protein C1orf43 homolog isoform X13 [Canis lupus familiaris]XP_025284617.1 protein C1orf43 homolog isoform X2 [Canis lupus dingo]XP_038399190.1 protein C1orf43 homolog isoform X11 [Canis lupus familiaris]|eukprot:XP_022277081.1 uncharacterized protein C1orf43 homolog isoform X2 [Canis lupus familiaris]